MKQWTKWNEADKESAIADLINGEPVGVLAKRINVPEGTVSNWYKSLTPDEKYRRKENMRRNRQNAKDREAESPKPKAEPPKPKPEPPQHATQAVSPPKPSTHTEFGNGRDTGDPYGSCREELRRLSLAVSKLTEVVLSMQSSDILTETVAPYIEQNNLNMDDPADFAQVTVEAYNLSKQGLSYKDIGVRIGCSMDTILDMINSSEWNDLSAVEWYSANQQNGNHSKK